MTDKVRWSSALELGVGEMDDAHRALLEMINALLDGSDNVVLQGMEPLVDMLERDFREEEMQMEHVDYSGVRIHREQHARVLAALHRIPEGDVTAARSALILLPQWFSLHLSTFDSALAAALARHAAGAEKLGA
jgi:hemerythrin-like metal-binding protein